MTDTKITKNFKNRFFLTSKLQKSDCIKLLDRFTLEELVNIIDITERDALISLISHSHSRSQLHALIYNSSLTEKDIFGIVYKNEPPTIQNTNAIN